MFKGYRQFNIFKTLQAFLIQSTDNVIYLWGNPDFGGSFAGKGTTTAGTDDSNKLEFQKDISSIVTMIMLLLFFY